MKRLGFALALVVSLFGCSLDSNVSNVPNAAPSLRNAPSIASNDLVAPPEIAASHGLVSFDLSAVINSTTNLPNFLYRGSLAAPTIRVRPGDTIAISMDDELPGGMGAGSDVNLHFHGLDTSPMRPADDVLTMLARPDRALYYVVPVPKTQPPGLYWYHPHVHGETNYQVGEGGMSGAIVVEGIESHFPTLAKMPERLLIVRQLGSAGGEARHPEGGPDGEMASMGSMRASPRVAPVHNVPCAPEPAGVYLSVNSQVQPTIRFRPGQPVFFRILNATGHRHLDLSLGGIPMHVVAIDGYPVDSYPGSRIFTQTHFVVPPAGRVEFFATITAATELRSLCFDSGPIGDADPEAILAHLRPSSSGSVATTTRAPFPSAVPLAFVESAPLPPPAATRLVRFSEDDAGFYINGKAFSPSAPPMFVVHTGTVERWRIENLTSEDHDFHLHQVHFLVERIDGVTQSHPLWKDVQLVPHRTRGPDGTWQPGSITVIADFRNPLVRGIFLFHCHILDHEDQGMMAKIQAL